MSLETPLRRQREGIQRTLQDFIQGGCSNQEDVAVETPLRRQREGIQRTLQDFIQGGCSNQEDVAAAGL